MYLKSKIDELKKKHADDRYSEHDDSCVGDGLYSSRGYKGIYNQMDPISKRRSLANDSKASVYFTPTDSIDQSQLQLSPIHINYIRDHGASYSPFTSPTTSTARQLFFHQRQLHSADASTAEAMSFAPLRETHLNGRAGMNVDDDDDDDGEVSETIVFTAESNVTNGDVEHHQSHNDYIPMNILCKTKSRIRCDSRDLYYSVENVFDPIESLSQIQLSNDELSDVQMSNSSASDNCIADDENTNTDWATGKVTPEKDIPNNSLEQNSSSNEQSLDGHCSESNDDSNEVILTIE